MTDPFDDAEHQAIVDDLIGRNQQILHNEDIVVNTAVGTRVFVGNTMIFGDTGLRNVASLLQPGWQASQTLYIRRVDGVVHLTGYTHSDGTATSQVMLNLPQGFYPIGTKAIAAPTTAAYPTTMQLLELSSSGLKAYGRPLSTPGTLYIEISWMTSDLWPTSLPGTPAT